MNKGFTLLELLIVIGILAILATATVLVLNPAELLRQARDSQRVSDLSTLNSALGLYVTSVGSPDLDVATTTLSSTVLGTECTGDGGFLGCFTDWNIATAGTSTGDSASCGKRASVTTRILATTTRTVAGAGWLPVNFTSISGGSPLSTLPSDPGPSTVIDNGRYYSYACNTTALTYELNTVFESTKYLTTDDLDGKDGGNSLGVYEVGTQPGLNL